MRISRRPKNKKKPNGYQRKNKKRYKKKSRLGWGRHDDISGLFLENLNEVLREKKFHRGESKGNWKIMPRDSCEIYKARQKRVETTRRKYNNDNKYDNDDKYNNDDSRETDSFSDDDDDDDDDRRSKRKQKRKNFKRRDPPKNFRPKGQGSKGKNKKRIYPRSRDSSKSSNTNSSYTRTTSYTSGSVSDMEY